MASLIPACLISNLQSPKQILFAICREIQQLFSTWNKPNWSHGENGWKRRWRNGAGAQREYETYRLIINERIRPFRTWKCAKHVSIPYDITFFVNFIIPNKGILPLRILPKFCLYGFRFLVLPLFKITLSHVILSYPSGSFYGRGTIALNGILAQYHRLWELVVLCWLHFCPSAQPSSVRPTAWKRRHLSSQDKKTNFLRP